ncbi:unnamed protein product [Dibothriocephalus latus]|uniref:Uncharacterized protein n=1 Tax=Dibothriocephalus latus TaxID=60516 RepID=A0A3P6Q7V9_DIBLA|nr:unnamed protein product [Dibothriocephalus latus]
MVNNLGHLPYEYKLPELELCALKYRQLRGDLIQTQRFVRIREFPLEFDEFIELAWTGHLRGHLFKLHRKPAHVKVRRRAFSQRVTGASNGHPDEVVLSYTVDTLKRKLDSHLLRYCDTYNEKSCH